MRVKSDHLLVYALFGAIVCTYLIMAIWFPMAYIWATYEDLVGEWMQFWFFVAALIFSSRLAFSGSRFRLFFGILALSCFYVSMEEISWGQRVLDISSPDFFKKYNIQKETNMHNLFTGPIATSAKTGIEYLLAIGLVLYGMIYPIMLRARWSLALRIKSFALASPPIYLWPYFVLGAILELRIFNFNEAEIAEILVSFALAVLAIHYWSEYRFQVKPMKNVWWNRVLSRQRAIKISVIFLGVVLLSLGSTYLSYTSSSNGPRIENRLLIGVEKFAGRYKKYGKWDTAAELYLVVHNDEPNRTSILRKVAYCFKKMGNKERFEFYNTMALNKDLERIKRKPKKISLNLSLARTYQQMGEDHKADYHLRKALRSALKRVKNKPESASAAYWLGKTYSMLDDNTAALGQFQRSYELKPHSIKYKKALINIMAAIEKNSHGGI